MLDFDSRQIGQRLWDTNTRRETRRVGARGLNCHGSTKPTDAALSWQGYTTLGREERVRQSLSPHGYLPLAMVGSGGFATVWKAYDVSARRTVAVKMLNADHVNDQNARKRFICGATILSTLDHPKIVQALSKCYTEDSGLFYVMEFVSEVTMQQLLIRRPIAYSRVLSFVNDVGAALGYMHDRNITHGDVHPRNVLIARNGATKLADFDLAQRPKAPKLNDFLQSDVCGLAMTAACALAGRTFGMPFALDTVSKLHARLTCPPKVRLLLIETIFRRGQCMSIRDLLDAMNGASD